MITFKTLSNQDTKNHQSGLRQQTNGHFDETKTTTTTTLNKTTKIIQQNNQTNRKIFKNPNFTRNPQELNGEFIKTKLLKTHNGFGFTIIGANETHEDFLQIKHIVQDGAAYHNKVLQPGDILVYVNNICVLGYTHQGVVEVFQSIKTGDYVELTVCRGRFFMFFVANCLNFIHVKQSQKVTR
jgi:type II secretory pathway component PulC